MEKLSMCRICLAEDGLRLIINTPLQEIYETLVTLPSQLEPATLQERVNKKRLSVAHHVIQWSIGDELPLKSESDNGLATREFLEVPVTFAVKQEVIDKAVDDTVLEEDSNDEDTLSANSDDDPLSVTRDKNKPEDENIMTDPKPSTSNDTFNTQMKKRTKIMSLDEKYAVLNTFKRLKETWPKHLFPYRTEIVKKTADLMGISYATVYRILNEEKNTGCLKSPPKPTPKVSQIDALDDVVLEAIRRKVHSLCTNDRLPTLDKVLAVVNNDETLPSFKRTTFSRLLLKLQFKYDRTKKK